MIDRSLRARNFDESSWADYPNRSDFPPVDNFRRGYDDQQIPDEPQGPPIHRRHREPEFVPRTKQRPEHGGEKLHKRMIAHKEEFIKEYGLPDVEVRVERRAGSAYQHPEPQFGIPGVLLVPEKHYEAVKKSKRKSDREQFTAINTHELGHHAQFAFKKDRLEETRAHSPRLQEIQEKSKNEPTRTIRSETFAWDVAKDYYKTKGKGWTGRTKLVNRWALGTYTGYTPPAMRGSNPKAVFDEERQLLVRPNEVGGISSSLFGGSGRSSGRRGRK